MALADANRIAARASFGALTPCGCETVLQWAEYAGAPPFAAYSQGFLTNREGRLNSRGEAYLVVGRHAA